MARILRAGRSGSCSWLGRGCPEDDWADAREAMRRVRPGSDGRFGFRFMKCSLSEGHSRLTLHRVRKLMRELGIRGHTPDKGKRTTIPGRGADPRPDLVRRDFISLVPT